MSGFSKNSNESSVEAESNVAPISKDKVEIIEEDCNETNLDLDAEILAPCESGESRDFSTEQSVFWKP